MAWVGGSDTERFLLWSAPVVLLLVGIAAADVDWQAGKGPLVLLGLGQMLSGRWFFTTPTTSIESLGHSWPILTPLHARQVEDLLSLTPDRVAGSAALIQYSVLTITLLLWLRRRAV